MDFPTAHRANGITTKGRSERSVTVRRTPLSTATAHVTERRPLASLWPKHTPKGYTFIFSTLEVLFFAVLLLA